MGISLDDFSCEKQCVYKGEQFSVRDNGSVLRHAREGHRLRKDDHRWTFGRGNTSNGYLEIGTAVIHRVVATAFHGASPSREYVVDHIDTNKQNNRPDNLRWVTRLENILLNPITAKRIAWVCGSVEAFLANPLAFREKFDMVNYSWMRPVSEEDARFSRDRLLAWAQSDRSLSSGGSLDEWLFRRGTSPVAAQQESSDQELPALSPGSVQKGWATSYEFPCAPKVIDRSAIFDYTDKLRIGQVFSRNKFSTFNVSEFAASADAATLWVICRDHEDTAVKPWSLVQVTFNDGLFVHASLGMFFDQAGALKQFTLAQGKEWTGGDTFDDYC